MTCNCGKTDKSCPKKFPSAVVEINNPEQIVLLRKVVIPASLGDDTEVPPVVGKYRNVVLQYEANDHIYLYSSDGIPTEVRVPRDILKRIEDLELADQIIEQEIEDLRNNPDVVDIVATHADLLEYDTSKLGDKDVIRVLTDETHDDESTYYRWDKPNQEWEFIGAVEGYYTKDQTDALLDDKQDVLTAGNNISIVDNTISATDTTYSPFVGATPILAGTSGLVPAPATTDAGKFLKADGTWDTAGGSGSGVIELTANDYNWNRTAGDDTTLPLDSIALWKLPRGWYVTSIGMQVLPYKTTDYSYAEAGTYILIGGETSSGPTTSIPNYVFKSGGVVINFPQKNTGNKSQNTRTLADTSIIGEMFAPTMHDYNWNSQTGTTTNPDCFAVWYSSYDTHPKTIAIGQQNYSVQEYKNGPIVDGSTAQTYIRGVKTGSQPTTILKIDSTGVYRIVLNSSKELVSYDTIASTTYVNNRITTNAGAPTTATVGTVGQLLEDTTNGKLYICTDATNPYVWEEVGSGGGGGATIFYKDSGLVGWGEDIEGPLFYKDSSYQTPATSSDIYAACMAGTTYICSNQSDDLFYTEIVAASNYSTNYTFSLANIEHGLGYDCTISSYISGGTEYYSFYYNEPVSINVVQTTGSSTTNVMSQNAVTTALSGKQGTLTAGTGISINNNVISATSGGLVTLSYGNSTWNDFITAYNAGEIVYCRASSGSDPGVGSQTRMAFMAYVNNATNPTEVEFQYVRSVSTKSAANQSDMVFVYKLTSAGTWTVEMRPIMVKIAAGTNAESSYASNTLTINPRLYTTTGQNTDGGVTQKLFTDTVGNIESALNLINNGGGN